MRLPKSNRISFYFFTMNKINQIFANFFIKNSKKRLLFSFGLGIINKLLLREQGKEVLLWLSR